MYMIDFTFNISIKYFWSGPPQRKYKRTRISDPNTPINASVKKNCVKIIKAEKEVKNRLNFQIYKNKLKFNHHLASKIP